MSCMRETAMRYNASPQLTTSAHYNREQINPKFHAQNARRKSSKHNNNHKAESLKMRPGKVALISVISVVGVGWGVKKLGWKVPVLNG